MLKLQFSRLILSAIFLAAFYCTGAVNELQKLHNFHEMEKNWCETFHFFRSALSSEKCQWTLEMSLFYVSHWFVYWLRAFVICLACERAKIQEKILWKNVSARHGIMGNWVWKISIIGQVTVKVHLIKFRQEFRSNVVNFSGKLRSAAVWKICYSLMKNNENLISLFSIFLSLAHFFRHRRYFSSFIARGNLTNRCCQRVSHV